MRSLPFVVPDDELSLNLAETMLVIGCLAQSSGDVPLLTTDRLRLYLLLVANPTLANKVLAQFGKKAVILPEHVAYSVATLAPRVRIYFDDSILRSLLCWLIAHGIVEVHFSEKIGFCYLLTTRGSELVETLRGGYFDLLRRYGDAVRQLHSQRVSGLERVIAEVIQRG